MSTHRRVLIYFASAIAAMITYFSIQPDALAVPSFARKYQTSCQTCHTVYPMLNSFGEAFRRDGYRFPSENGSVDSDVVKADTIALGQEEYKKTFPDSVWPDVITQAVPLSGMINGGVAMNMPDSDAKAGAGNVFTWDGIVEEAHLFAAGAFNDKLTYFTQLTFASDGLDLETGYVLWSDIVGPRHLVNLWAGRMMAPQLTSWALHSSYLSDSYMPATSIGGLYSASGNGFSLGMGHSDGVEVNGIVAHRMSYALGWLASQPSDGLNLPNAEEAYAHLGFKLGGMSLDGEGAGGAHVTDPKKPWAETSVTLDLFGYHGLSLNDNGTGIDGPIAQNDSVNAIGGALRVQIQSLNINAGLQVEHHSAPYPGSAATPAAPPDQPNDLPGAPDFTSGTGVTQYNEINYVIFPWLVPGIRTEYTHLDLEGGGAAGLLRVIPGVAMAMRPNIRLILTADFEYAHGLPPTGAWDAAGGAIVAPDGQDSKLEAETVNATMNWAF